jgi:hypothetical protein
MAAFNLVVVAIIVITIKETAVHARPATANTLRRRGGQLLVEVTNNTISSSTVSSR